MIKSDDLHFFNNLVAVDLSDNQLNSQSELEKLALLRSLRHINLAYNNIDSLAFLDSNP